MRLRGCAVDLDEAFSGLDILYKYSITLSFGHKKLVISYLAVGDRSSWKNMSV